MRPLPPKDPDPGRLPGVKTALVALWGLVPAVALYWIAKLHAEAVFEAYRTALLTASWDQVRSGQSLALAGYSLAMLLSCGLLKAGLIETARPPLARVWAWSVGRLRRR
jgi:hypothetical protein